MFPIKKKKIEEFLKNLLLTVITLLIILIIVEIILSVLNIPRYSSLPETFRKPDPVVHHGFIPNSYGKLSSSEFDTEYFINKFGLRDKEINQEKNKYRILMLGDSFTEGHGVNIEGTIAKQLESMLNKEGYNVEVINAGVSSYSPILEYIYLKNEGILLNPDMVILNLDLTDSSDDNAYEQLAIFDVRGGIVAVPGEKGVQTSIKGKIEYFCIKYKFNICILFGRTTLKVKSFFGKPSKIKQYDIPSEFLFKTFGYIKKIKDFNDANNIKFVLVTYPHAPQVSEEEWVIGRKEVVLDTFTEFSLNFLDKVYEFTKDENITYVDTLYKFKKYTGITTLL